MTERRRFPAPWSVDLVAEAFVVRDGHGAAVAYVYFDSDPSRSAVTGRMSRDDARRIAANIAKLPHLLSKPAPDPEGAG